MDIMMTSKSSKKGSSNSTVAASAHHQHQHRHQQHQEAMGTAPQVVEARKVKQARQQAAAGERKPRPQLDEALRCPRCDSSNTKFCYYNNYSTLQPRYLCKACRRYWTQGGSLRNVPIGGGCRKNKRSFASLLPSSSSNSSSIDKQQQQQHLVLASSTAEPQDFPNVLPTFMSTSFELPSTHLPPFTPLSLPNLVPAPPMTFGAETSFLDMLRGGFLGDHQGNNGFYRPTSSDMEHGMVGDHGGGATPIDGGGATHQGGQWPTTTQVCANQQQEGVSVPDTARAK